MTIQMKKTIETLCVGLTLQTHDALNCASGAIKHRVKIATPKEINTKTININGIGLTTVLGNIIGHTFSGLDRLRVQFVLQMQILPVQSFFLLPKFLLLLERIREPRHEKIIHYFCKKKRII